MIRGFKEQFCLAFVALRNESAQLEMYVSDYSGIAIVLYVGGAQISAACASDLF